ncbi:hypothetical protein [Streptomyces dangxiongensis]|uniref:hypothetical protein n=1 Tax=Streptomyces dangxiongensis TaxID=1442032 RepID=UPI0013CE5388|nr:hypothetical protein [Streptomyces dangxiongensis]
MSRPSSELVRAHAARYRERVADSCATALTSDPSDLVVDGIQPGHVHRQLLVPNITA